MMTELLIKTRTYQIKEHPEFRVDVVYDGDMQEAYLYNPKCSIKLLMFGYPDSNRKRFLKIVEKEVEKYIAIYEEEYMD